MIYLDSFSLASENDENNFISFGYQAKMTCYRSFYPFNIFPLKGFERMDFDAPITILYGDFFRQHEKDFMCLFL